jgi:hypothetical protein
MWHENCGFTGDTIAHINEGCMQLAGFDLIIARHAAQEAVFVLARTKDEWMAGIGCSGYDDKKPVLMADLGVLEADWDSVSNWSGTKDGNDSVGLHCFRGDEVQEFTVPYELKYQTIWTGVLPSTVIAFRAWLLTVLPKQSDKPDHEWVNAINWNHATRSNQGDAFFVKHLGGELPTSVAGEAEPPLLTIFVEEVNM